MEHSLWRSWRGRREASRRARRATKPPHIRTTCGATLCALPDRLFQLVNVVANWDKLRDESARFFTLLVLAAAVVGAVVTIALPAPFYMRHR